MYIYMLWIMILLAHCHLRNLSYDYKMINSYFEFVVNEIFEFIFFNFN